MAERTPAEAAAATDFGSASARKSGRNSVWPYVPVVLHTEGFERTRQEQILGKAFATREEAVAHAQAVIDHRRSSLEGKLSLPNFRALRAQYGVTEKGN